MIGLYAEVYAPIVKGGGYLSTIQKFDSYSHAIGFVGGFLNASLSLSVGQAVADDWLEKGLGRQIKVINHLGGIVWQGFVNNITVSAGAQTYGRGPLMDIGNRVGVTYSPMVDGASGSTLITPLADDLPSQLDYGIFEKWGAAGTCVDGVEIKVRDVFLAQNRLPKTIGDFSITGQGAALGLSLELLGNVEWLKVYPYSIVDTINKSYITAYEKLILALDDNIPINPGVWSTDYKYIIDNPFPVIREEDSLRIAWDIMQEILSLGNDTNDLRRGFGLYENNEFYYDVMPSTIEYEYRLSTQRQMIRGYNTNILVYPWDVRPGKWIRTSDWMIGRILNSTDLFGDPRNKFIENVSFSAPWTVGISGSPVDTLSQMLAKITYTGGIY